MANAHVGVRTVTRVERVTPGAEIATPLWDLCLQQGEGAQFETHTAFTADGQRHTFVMRWVVEYAKGMSEERIPGFPHAPGCAAPGGYTVHCSCLRLHVKSRGDATEAVDISFKRCIRCNANLMHIDSIFENDDADVSNLLSTYGGSYAYGRLIMWTIAELAAKFANGNVSTSELADNSRMLIAGACISLAERNTLLRGAFSSYYEKYGFQTDVSPNRKGGWIAPATLRATLNTQLQEQLRVRTITDIVDGFPVARWAELGVQVQPQDTLAAAMPRLKGLSITEMNARAYADLIEAATDAVTFPELKTRTRPGNLWDACAALGGRMRVPTAEFLEKCRAMRASDTETVRVLLPPMQRPRASTM
jgi:hypothetical protein